MKNFLTKNKIAKIGLVSIALSSGLYGEDLKKVLEDAQLSGFLFGKYFAGHGQDGGQKFQWRAKADLTSGAVNGFSFTSGILFSNGSSTLNGGNTDSLVGGTRALRNSSTTDTFNIAQFYASKEFINSESDSYFKSIKVDAGRMNLDSAMTNITLDLGLGARLYMQDPFLKYQVSFYDTWATDTVYLGMLARNGIPSPAGNNTNFGIGNNLILASVETTKDLKEKGIEAGAYYGYIADFFPLLFTAKGKYSFNGFYVGAQIAAAAPSSNVRVKGNVATNYITEEFSATQDSNSQWKAAGFRGVFNVNVGYEYEKLFSAKVGYLQSFGDGYGVFLQLGGFDVAANSYYNSYSSAFEGFSIIGSGSRANTNINIEYVELKGALPNLPELQLGLSASLIGGKNNLLLPTKATKDLGNENKPLKGYSSQGFANLSLVDISPNVSYQFNKSGKFSIYYSYVFGTIEMGRITFSVDYKI